MIPTLPAQGRTGAIENSYNFPLCAHHFLNRPGSGGGAGCAGCHRPPEFDIDPNSGNNGVVSKIGGGIDTPINASAEGLLEMTAPVNTGEDEKFYRFAYGVTAD